MGTLYYEGSAKPIHIDDRALAHLKVVITTKLRRSESFTVTWRHPDGHAPGRSVIWLHPSISLRIVFQDPEPIKLNQQWLEELARSANSSAGMTLAGDAPIAESSPVLALAQPQVASDIAVTLDVTAINPCVTQSWFVSSQRDPDSVVGNAVR